MTSSSGANKAMAGSGQSQNGTRNRKEITFRDDNQSTPFFQNLTPSTIPPTLSQSHDNLQDSMRRTFAEFALQKQNSFREFQTRRSLNIRPKRKSSEASTVQLRPDSSGDDQRALDNNTIHGNDFIISLPMESFGQSCLLLRDGLKNMNRKMKRSRLVRKDGYCNVYQTNVPSKERQYLRDIFTTLIDAKWRYLLGCFCSFFCLTWIIFALIYYLCCLINGDIGVIWRLRAAASTGGNASASDSEHKPCVTNIDSFIAAFLFSVESEHTIGFGFRYMTTTCPVPVIALCIQVLCGLLVQSFMVGLVFAKMARPKKRAETLIFSEKAVISLRDGQLCLLFRVGDMRISHLVEAHLRLQMITNRTTAEGEVEPLYQYDMDVGYDEGMDRIFLVWPITICHVIDENSPLYHFSARQVPTAQFEIIVLLEGIVESTGMTAQAKTSYLPSEILWGHRFEKLVSYQKCNGSYQIDYSLFHNTYAVNTPRCSAKELERMKEAGVQLGSSGLFFCKTQEEAELEESTTETGELTPAAADSVVESTQRRCSTMNRIRSPAEFGRKAEVLDPALTMEETELLLDRSPTPPPPPTYPPAVSRRRRSSIAHQATLLPNPSILINSQSHPGRLRNVSSPDAPPQVVKESFMAASGVAVSVTNDGISSFSNIAKLEED